MRTVIERLNLTALRGQDTNARFMRSEQFNTLVANIQRDGALTSVPLVRVDGDGHRILSGHHRVKAAIAAGVTEAECMVVVDEMTRQQEVALVLSHNAIAGEDDPATLKRLYEELDDPDWRWYSGLDDRTLEMLEKVSTEALSEANLEFSTVSLVFLPHERDAAADALAEAKKQSGAGEFWLAGIAQYEPVLSALESAHSAFRVGNVATAFELVLAVFERHLADLAEGWLGEDGEPNRSGTAPIESVLGTRTVPVETAAVIRRALNEAVEAGDVADGDVWALVEQWALDYVAQRG